VASGPGSFTGLRVGIAAMQGFAAVTGRPVVGVPVLEALGHLGSAGREPGCLIAVWMDAHRRDVFAALYEVTSADRFEREHLVEVEAPLVGEPGALINAWRPLINDRDVVWIGDGAAANAAAIARLQRPAPILPHPIAAGAIGRLAIARARRGEARSAAAVQPVYLRRPDAEIDRERRAAAAGRAVNAGDVKGRS
jgi:tRNA threonylcarbamoyladenosine biosynthesis protein TsaB